MYRFLGWSDGTETYPAEELPEVTADVTYTAEFEESPRDYTVTWVIDGESEDSTWGYGETPSHEIPEKESTEDTVYRFLGWSDGTDTYAPEELPEVTGDVTYTAEFEESPREYTITWLDGDGNTLLEESVAYGETPEYTGDDEPTKEADGNYRYSFNGTWDPEIEAVTGEATYTAQFDEIPLYSVTVIDPDNSPTMTADVTKAAEGDTVTVTVTADGYDIESILVSTEDDEFEAEGENGVYTFEMPASDVTVEASLSPILYHITALDPDIQNTMVQALDDNGDENNERYTDETITLRIMWPVEAVTLNSVTLSWDGGSETLTWDPDTLTWTGDTENLTYAGDSSSPNSNVNNFTFTMPPSNVTIETDFTVLYNITVNYDESNGGGDVNTGIVTPTVDGEPVSQASPGDKVVLDIQLYNGYTVDFITYYAGDDSFLIEPVDGEYSFEMPDMDVRVYVSLSGT